MQNRDINTIKPYPKNAKEHPDKQIDQIARSIQEFGFNQPIVVDKDGVIIVGHGRYVAACKLGLDTVPVHEVDLPKEKADAYRLADNKLNESEWDMDLVIEELREIDASGLDITITGFDLDLITDKKAEDEELPEVPAVPKAQLGDLYQLGNHRLLCGDATKVEDIEKLMDDQKADMYLSDPPYNVDYTGKTKDALKIENDKKEDGDFRQFLTDAFFAVDTILKPGAVFYIWHADSEGYNFRGACQYNNWKVRQCLIWNKNSMVMGRQDYHWKHEPCLYGWKEGAGHLWATDRKQTTVLSFDRPSKSEIHPTMKPVELLAYQIQNNTKGEDIVVDTFLGSGSTMIACEQTDRVCYGMELDPKYIDVIIKRWENYTGNKAIKI